MNPFLIGKENKAREKPAKPLSKPSRSQNAPNKRDKKRNSSKKFQNIQSNLENLFSDGINTSPTTPISPNKFHVDAGRLSQDRINSLENSLELSTDFTEESENSLQLNENEIESEDEKSDSEDDDIPPPAPPSLEDLDNFSVNDTNTERQSTLSFGGSVEGGGKKQRKEGNSRIGTPLPNAEGTSFMDELRKRINRKTTPSNIINERPKWEAKKKEENKQRSLLSEKRERRKKAKMEERRKLEEEEKKRRREEEERILEEKRKKEEIIKREEERKKKIAEEKKLREEEEERRKFEEEEEERIKRELENIEDENERMEMIEKEKDKKRERMENFEMKKIKDNIKKREMEIQYEIQNEREEQEKLRIVQEKHEEEKRKEEEERKKREDEEERLRIEEEINLQKEKESQERKLRKQKFEKMKEEEERKVEEEQKRIEEEAKQLEERKRQEEIENEKKRKEEEKKKREEDLEKKRKIAQEELIKKEKERNNSKKNTSDFNEWEDEFEDDVFEEDEIIQDDDEEEVEHEEILAEYEKKDVSVVEEKKKSGVFKTLFLKKKIKEETSSDTSTTSKNKGDISDEIRMIKEKLKERENIEKKKEEVVMKFIKEKPKKQVVVVIDSNNKVVAKDKIEFEKEEAKRQKEREKERKKKKKKEKKKKEKLKREKEEKMKREQERIKEMERLKEIELKKIREKKEKEEREKKEKKEKEKEEKEKKEKEEKEMQKEKDVNPEDLIGNIQVLRKPEKNEESVEYHEDEKEPDVQPRQSFNSTDQDDEWSDDNEEEDFSKKNVEEKGNDLNKNEEKEEPQSDYVESIVSLKKEVSASKKKVKEKDPYYVNRNLTIEEARKNLRKVEKVPVVVKKKNVQIFDPKKPRRFVEIPEKKERKSKTLNPFRFGFQQNTKKRWSYSSDENEEQDDETKRDFEEEIRKSIIMDPSISRNSEERKKEESKKEKEKKRVSFQEKSFIPYKEEKQKEKLSDLISEMKKKQKEKKRKIQNPTPPVSETSENEEITMLEKDEEEKKKLEKLEKAKKKFEKERLEKLKKDFKKKRSMSLSRIFSKKEKTDKPKLTKEEKKEAKKEEKRRKKEEKQKLKAEKKLEKDEKKMKKEMEKKQKEKEKQQKKELKDLEKLEKRKTRKKSLKKLFSRSNSKSKSKKKSESKETSQEQNEYEDEWSESETDERDGRSISPTRLDMTEEETQEIFKKINKNESDDSESFEEIKKKARKRSKSPFAGFLKKKKEKSKTREKSEERKKKKSKRAKSVLSKRSNKRNSSTGDDSGKKGKNLKNIFKIGKKNKKDKKEKKIIGFAEIEDESSSSENSSEEKSKKKRSKSKKKKKNRGWGSRSKSRSKSKSLKVKKSSLDEDEDDESKKKKFNILKMFKRDKSKDIDEKENKIQKPYIKTTHLQKVMDDDILKRTGIGKNKAIYCVMLKLFKTTFRSTSGNSFVIFSIVRDYSGCFVVFINNWHRGKISRVKYILPIMNRKTKIEKYEELCTDTIIRFRFFCEGECLLFESSNGEFLEISNVLQYIFVNAIPDENTRELVNYRLRCYEFINDFIPYYERSNANDEFEIQDEMIRILDDSDLYLASGSDSIGDSYEKMLRNRISNPKEFLRALSFFPVFVNMKSKYRPSKHLELILKLYEFIITKPIWIEHNKISGVIYEVQKFFDGCLSSTGRENYSSGVHGKVLNEIEYLMKMTELFFLEVSNYTPRGKCNSIPFEFYGSKKFQFLDEDEINYFREFDDDHLVCLTDEEMCVYVAGVFYFVNEWSEIEILVKCNSGNYSGSKSEIELETELPMVKLEYELKDDEEYEDLFFEHNKNWIYSYGKNFANLIRRSNSENKNGEYQKDSFRNSLLNSISILQDDFQCEISVIYNKLLYFGNRKIILCVKEIKEKNNNEISTGMDFDWRKIRIAEHIMYEKYYLGFSIIDRLEILDNKSKIVGEEDSKERKSQNHISKSIEFDRKWNKKNCLNDGFYLCYLKVCKNKGKMKILVDKSSPFLPPLMFVSRNIPNRDEWCKIVLAKYKNSLDVLLQEEGKKRNKLKQNNFGFESYKKKTNLEKFCEKFWKFRELVPYVDLRMIYDKKLIKIDAKGKIQFCVFMDFLTKEEDDETRMELSVPEEENYEWLDEQIFGDLHTSCFHPELHSIYVNKLNSVSLREGSNELYVNKRVSPFHKLQRDWREMKWFFHLLNYEDKKKLSKNGDKKENKLRKNLRELSNEEKPVKERLEMIKDYLDDFDMNDVDEWKRDAFLSASAKFSNITSTKSFNENDDIKDQSVVSWNDISNRLDFIKSKEIEKIEKEKIPEIMVTEKLDCNLYEILEIQHKIERELSIQICSNITDQIVSRALTRTIDNENMNVAATVLSEMLDVVETMEDMKDLVDQNVLEDKLKDVLINERDMKRKEIGMFLSSIEQENKNEENSYDKCIEDLVLDFNGTIEKCDNIMKTIDSVQNYLELVEEMESFQDTLNEKENLENYLSVFFEKE